jgi:hypothetical protein
MLSYFNDVSAANVHNRAANTLCRFDNDVVVLCHLESVEFLRLPPGYVEHTLVNGIGHAVVDELCQYQTVLALVKHLERVGREGQAGADVWVSGKNGIDVAGELSAFVLVDGVGDVGAGPLDEDLAVGSSADAVLRGMSAGSL